MTGPSPAPVVDPPEPPPARSSHPQAQSPQGDTPQPPAPRPMRRWRVWMVFGLLAFLVLGHGVEVVTQREHWPFSPYQMWSRPSRGWELNREMLRGVTDEREPREVALQPGQLYPIPYQM